MSKYFTVIIGFDGDGAPDLQKLEAEELIWNQLDGALSEGDDPLECVYVEVDAEIPNPTDGTIVITK